MKTATANDIPALVEMGRALHAEKQVRYPFIAADFSVFCGRMLDDETTTVLMDGKGFICGAVIPQPSNADYRIAYEMFFWAGDGSGRGLLRAFERWAQDMGCSEVVMSYPSGERVGRYFERFGYEPETNMVGKVLTCA